MRFLLLLVFLMLLALPVADLVLAVQWVAKSPPTGIIYLIAIAACGFACIKFARVGFRELFRQAGLMREIGGRAALTLVKLYIIGLLLIFPGYLSDGLAIILWFWLRGNIVPINDSNAAADEHAGDEIELEGRLIDDDKNLPR